MIFTLNDFKKSELSSKAHFFVIGHPISHSLSPLMHQLALDECQIPAAYVALDLQPDQLTDFIAWCNRDEFIGCNITIPYKEMMMDVVDELDDIALQVNVINTIAKHNGSLKGFNTDVYGFTEPLREYKEELLPGRAIIFGTGGASKAVQTALENLGFDELVFVSRSAAGKQIESTIDVHITDYNRWTAFADEASIVVNTTPLGMYPHTENSPIQVNEADHLEGKICYDLVYNPLETTFLKHAKNHGGIAINGLDMLIFQGSKSFEIWTGRPFPVLKVRKHLLNYFDSE